MPFPRAVQPVRAEALVRRGRGWVLGLLVLVIGGAVFLRTHRAAVPPVPVPSDLATLDPQVRAHLAGLVQRITESPRDPDLRADLGLAFAVNGLWEQARESFQHACQLGSPGPLPPMYAAIALQELGEEQEALAELRSLVRRFPDSCPAWYRLGRALLGTGDFPEASRAFQEVTRLAPEVWQGWAGLGEAALRTERPQDAIDSLERARRIEGTARSVHHLLGQAYRATGRLAEAEVESAAGTGQTLTPLPDDWSLRALGHMKRLPDQLEQTEALVIRGQPIEAIHRLREALHFHPTNATVITGLARALVAADRAAAARELLASATAQWPEEVQLLTAGAETAALLDLPSEALELAERALSLAPKSAEAHVAQANALLAAGRDEAALAALQAAARLTPGNPSLQAQMGDLQWSNLQQPDAARDAYHHALRLDPIQPGVLFRLASLEIDCHRFAEAHRLLARFKDLRGDPQALRHLEDRLRESESAQ